MMQKIQMIFDPVDGKALGPDCQLPKDAAEYREVVKNLTWRYNPWTGAKRPHAEMEADTQGVLICPWVSLTAAAAAPAAQEQRMIYNPSDGKQYAEGCAPLAGAFRESFPGEAWGYNPWTGYERYWEDIAADPLGYKIVHVPIGKRPTVPELLEGMASTYRERNKTYGDNYKKLGAQMVAMFPDGLPKLDEAGWNRFGVWFMALTKLQRYAESLGTGGHADSAHDAAVYSAMLEELTK
jgi:hypothetical protein